MFFNIKGPELFYHDSDSDRESVGVLDVQGFPDTLDPCFVCFTLSHSSPGKPYHHTWECKIGFYSFFFLASQVLVVDICLVFSLFEVPSSFNSFNLPHPTSSFAFFLLLMMPIYHLYCYPIPHPT